MCQKRRWTVAIVSEQTHFMSRSQTQPRLRPSIKTIVLQLFLLTIGCCSLLTSAKAETSRTAFAVSPSRSRLEPHSRIEQDERFSLPVEPPYSLSQQSSAVQPVYRQLPVPSPPPPPPLLPSHYRTPSNAHFRYFSSNATNTHQLSRNEEENGDSMWPHPSLRETSRILSVTTAATSGVVLPSDSSAAAVGSQLFDNPPMSEGSEVGDLGQASLPNMDNVNQNNGNSSVEGQMPIEDEYFGDYVNADQPQEYVDGEEPQVQPQINVTVTDPGFITNVIHNKDENQPLEPQITHNKDITSIVTDTPKSLDSVDNRLEPVGMPTSQREVAVTPPTILPAENNQQQTEVETDQAADADYISEYNDTLTLDANGSVQEGTEPSADVDYVYYDQAEGDKTHEVVETAVEGDVQQTESDVGHDQQLSSHSGDIIEDKLTTTSTTTTTTPPPAPSEFGGAVSALDGVVSYGEAEEGYHSASDDEQQSEISEAEVAEPSLETTSTSTTTRTTPFTITETTTELVTTTRKGYTFAPRTTPNLLPVPVTTTTSTTTTPVPRIVITEIATETSESHADVRITHEELIENPTTKETPITTTGSSSTTTATTTSTSESTTKALVSNKSESELSLSSFLDTYFFNKSDIFGESLGDSKVNVTDKSIETTPRLNNEETEVAKNRSPLPSFKEIILKPSSSQKQTTTTAATTSTTTMEPTASETTSPKTTTSKSRSRSRSRSGMITIPTESIPAGLLPPGFNTESPITVVQVPLKSKLIPDGRKLSGSGEKRAQTTSTESSIKSQPEINSSAISTENITKDTMSDDNVTTTTTATATGSNTRFPSLSRKPFLVTRSGPAAARPPVKIASRKTSDILNRPRVTLRPIGRRINTNGHEGEYQSDPDSRTDSSATEGPPTTTTKRVVTTLSPYFLWGQSVEIASILKIEDGAEWTPELEDHRSSQYQELANNVEKQLDSLFRRSDFGNRYKGIQIEGFSKGSVIVDYTLYLTESEEPLETTILWESITRVLENGTNMGSFVVDPGTISFEVIRKITPPPEVTADNLLLPHWAIAVIVIAAASFLFLIILCLALTRNKRGAKRKLYGNVLQEDSITERNKNWDKSTYDNLGAASSIYDTNDTWDEKKLKQQQKNYNYNLYSVNPPSTGYYSGQKHSYHGSLNKLDQYQHQAPSEHQRHSTSGGTLHSHYSHSNSNNPEDPYGRYYDSWRSEWSRITKGSTYKPPDYDTTF
ncbi:hypothetical protein CHUAL_010460 [Chamberlinius hualienensis]